MNTIVFRFGIFLSVALSGSMYISASRPSLSRCCSFFPIIYPFAVSVMIFSFSYFTPKLLLFLHPVVAISAWILHQLVGRIFFCWFGVSCFIILFDLVSLSFKSLFFCLYLLSLSSLVPVFKSLFSCPYLLSLSSLVSIFLSLSSLVPIF